MSVFPSPPDPILLRIRGMRQGVEQPETSGDPILDRIRGITTVLDVPQYATQPEAPQQAEQPQVLGQPGAPLPGLGQPDLPPQSIFPSQPMGQYQAVPEASPAPNFGLYTDQPGPPPLPSHLEDVGRAAGRTLGHIFRGSPIMGLRTMEESIPEPERLSGKAAEFVGGFAEYAPAMLHKAFLPVIVAKNSFETSVRTLVETGDERAAIGAGLIEAGSLMLGFKIAGGKFGKQIQRNVANLIFKGEGAAAAKIIANLAGASGSVAGINELALIFNEMQKAAFGTQSQEEAWQRIAEATPETLKGGALSGLIIAGGGAVHAAPKFAKLRMSVSRDVRKARETLRTSQHPDTSRKITTEERQDLQERVDLYDEYLASLKTKEPPSAVQVKEAGKVLPPLSARAGQGTKEVPVKEGAGEVRKAQVVTAQVATTSQTQVPPSRPPSAKPPTTAEVRPATGISEQPPSPTSVSAGESTQQLSLASLPYRELQSRAKAAGINARQSKPKLVEALSSPQRPLAQKAKAEEGDVSPSIQPSSQRELVSETTVPSGLASSDLSAILAGEVDHKTIVAGKSQPVQPPPQGGKQAWEQTRKEAEEHNLGTLRNIENGIEEFSNYAVTASVRLDATRLLDNPDLAEVIYKKYAKDETKGMVQGGPVQPKTASLERRAIATAAKNLVVHRRAVASAISRGDIESHPDYPELTKEPKTSVVRQAEVLGESQPVGGVGQVPVERPSLGTERPSDAIRGTASKTFVRSSQSLQEAAAPLIARQREIFKQAKAIAEKRTKKAMLGGEVWSHLPNTPVARRLKRENAELHKQIADLEEQYESTTKEPTDAKAKPPQRRGLVYIPGPPKLSEISDIREVPEAVKLVDQWLSERDVSNTQAKVRAGLHSEALKEVVGRRSVRETVGEALKYGNRGQVRYRQLDQAMHLYIDLKGRAEEQFEQYSVKLTAHQRRLYELSQSLPKEAQALADQIIQENTETGIAAVEAGVIGRHIDDKEAVIANLVENYTARIWAKPEQETKGLRGKFTTQTARAKQRTLDSILHGWSLGKELQVKGAIQAQLTATEQILQVITDRNLIELASKAGVISDRRVEPDWRVIDHPSFTKWVDAGEAEPGKVYGRGLYVTEKGRLLREVPLYSDKSTAKHLNNVLGRSALYDIPGLTTLTKYNAIIKAQVLFTSFFHHQAFLRSYALASPGINPVKGYKLGMKAIENFTPDVEELVRAGLTIGARQDFEQVMLEDKTIIGEVIDKIPMANEARNFFLALRDQQIDFLFGRLGPGLKVGAAILDYNDRLVQNHDRILKGLTTREIIAKSVAENMNADFGGLNLPRLGKHGRNPTAQHIFRLLALAPDWTESNLRLAVHAFGRGDRGRAARMMWGRALVRAGVVSIVWNALMAGLDDEEDFWSLYQKMWRRGGLVWLGGLDITPIYRALGGTSEKRKYFSIIGHFRHPFRWVANPARTIKGKVSILGGILIDAVTGTDWRGMVFTSWQELFGIDDKGVYKTNRAPKGDKPGWKVGDPKGGKLKGQTVAWKFAGGGAIRYEQLPSFLLNQAAGTMPIQGQALKSWLLGEMDGFDAISRSMGLDIATADESRLEDADEVEHNTKKPKPRKRPKPHKPVGAR